MEMENPHTQKKKHLIIKYDSCLDLSLKMKLKQELDETINQERLFNQKMLDELQGKIIYKAVEIKKVKQEIPTKTAQYKKAIELYRDIMGQYKDGVLIKEGLLHQARKLKKETQC